MKRFRRPRLRIWQWLLLAPFAIAALAVLQVLILRIVPPFTSAFMIASDAPEIRYDWVPWQRIAPVAGLAMVAAEDQKFPEHWGFDFEAIDKALDHNKRSRRMRGASTISQQTAKNLFLWSGRSYIRKGLEVGYTLLIETFWPKRRVLEMYLNIAQFGPGVYGVEAAAQLYFHKPAARLSRSEAALLAAVLPNPVRLRVDRPSAYVLGRANQIEGQMQALGSDYLADLH
ncbi:monofunctional biosynthetic peptidoglycan transglycosylase [uncultured Nevskia sp.]|uniref:monofunctional biosynthetic peptidoglycan transglycosylase n=1 Tax=uncultured Nevskia sp. TaxID=228950 RepID=UPI0025E7444B|nr:monofunctional biosynthetic peptidoglycan transglycosylase [uncultured Nevskia sp.]